MEVVGVRTPSSRAPPQSPKLGGCVGVFFNFFDLNKRLQGSRLFSKRLPAERPSKDRDGKAARDDNLIAAKLLLIADENRSVPSSKKASPEKAKSTKQGSSPAPAGSSSSDKDGGVSVSPPKRVPGVVARLMGLESFPSSSETRSTSTSRIADSSQPSSAPQSPRRQQQESYCRPDSTGGGAGDRGRSKMSCKGKVPASVRRASPSPSASPSAAGDRKSQPPPSSSAGTGKGKKAAASASASAMHVQASEIGVKRSPRHHMHHQHTTGADSRSSYSSDSRFSESGGMSPVYVDPDLTCNTRHVPAAAAGQKGGGVVQEETKAGLPKSNSSSPRRPILLPSKNNKKLSSPIRSPTRMGSKSAAILLEAAQKILEPNNVKGRVAGRPSPVKPFQDCENGGPVPGGRRSLDFRGISSGREWWEQEEDGGGAGSRRRAGSSSPGPRPHNVLGMHSVVTLRPCSPVPSERQVGGNNGAGAAMGMRGLDGVGEVDEGRAQVPTARAMLFGITSPTRKRPGQLADVDAMPMPSSFRVQAARDTDFEAVLSRYQDPPKVETGRKKEKEKEMFGKHNQLGKMTAEQKSELVRSLSVTDQSETLHRSGSVKEKVSSKVGALLRSKSAREDKKLVKQAQFAEGQPVQQQQVKGNGDVVGKLGRAPAQRQFGSGTGNAKAFPGTTGAPSPYVAAGKVESGGQEQEKEKQDSAGARAMKVLRGKPGRRRRQEREEDAQECRDVSPPPGESRVFPAAGDAEMPTHISPGSSSESQGGSEVSSSGGGKGILSYSRLFRSRKEGHGDGEEEQSPKSSHSVRSLFRWKPTSPEAPAPVVLRRGSKKIQADMKAPGAGQAMSMSFDLDAEGFERGLSFDMGKLPLGCLISELADVLECKDKNTTSEERHVGPSTEKDAALGPVDADDSIQLRETCREGAQNTNRLFQLPDTDGFEEKTIDQDYQRRKSQARLTRALQRGAVTQFRGDVFKYDFSVDATMEEEEPDKMFAAYIKSGVIDEFTMESTFQQDELDKKFAGYIPASDSLMDQDLVCHSISLSNDAALDVDGVGAKKDAICILTESSQVLDSLKPSSISFDIGSYGSGSPLAVPLVNSKVFLSEENSDPAEAARKSTCSDDIGQPSPVSPLEAPFQDEAQDAASQERSSPKASHDFVATLDELEEDKAVVLSTVVDDPTASHHGAEKEQQSKVDGSTAPIETASILEAILDLSRIRRIDLADIGILEGAAAAAGADDAEDEDQAYITDILTKSKFLEKEPTPWFSQTLPINPDVFAQLENQERAWSETDSCKADSSVAGSDTTSCSRSDSKLLQVQWLDRKLFFDCVNEAVCERLSEYSMNEPWVKKQVLRAVPAPTGKQLVKQVYEQVSQWRNMDVESLETLILYDMGHGSGQWADLAHEVREIGLEIERHIFRVMIEELVKETLDSVPASHHWNS